MTSPLPASELRARLTGIDLAGTKSSHLVVWLAAQCHDGTPETIMAGSGSDGEMTLDELTRPTFDAAGVSGPGPDLGAMGEADPRRASGNRTRRADPWTDPEQLDIKGSPRGVMQAVRTPAYRAGVGGS
jgi:hypothetical protein